MRRIFLTFVLLALVVCALAVPSFAVSYHPNAEIVDYVDFIESVDYSTDGYGIVDMRFPSNICYCATYDSVLGRYTNQRIGDYVEFKTSSDASQSPIFFPIGWYGTRRLSLAGIPDGTWFKFWYDVSVSSSSQIVFADRLINSRVSYWDKNGYFISEQIDDSMVTEDSGYFSLVITDIPKNAVSCAISVEFWSVQSVNSEDVTVKVTLSDFLFQMQLSALQIQNDLTLKQQAMLNEFNTNQQVTNEKLDAIQDKFDSITDYAPTPDDPPLKDSVDDLDSIEQDALDNVHTGMDDAQGVFDSVFNTLGDYVQSFAVVSIFFNTFADLPFFRALLAISLSLGIVSAILGIGIGAVRSASRGSDSSKSSKKG